MDKETLSNYGWIVIAVLVLAVMITLATPFGKFVSTAVTNTTNSIFNTQTISLLEISTQKHSSEIVPKNAQYILTTGEVLKQGDKMPDTPQIGDIYIYGDYEYRYGQQYGADDWQQIPTEQLKYGQGWGVHVIDDTKETYGAIIETINGEPIRSLYATFRKCYKLTTFKGINIPDTVTTMDYTFAECGNIKSISGLNLPSSLVKMNATFLWCNSINDMHNLKIPSTVRYMVSAFVANTNMTIAPKIPENVETIQNAFAYCRALIQLPEIPESVNNCYSSFAECTKATGTVKIGKNVNKFNDMFSNVDFKKQGLRLVGESEKLDEIGATGINYCNECNGGCNNNH